MGRPSKKRITMTITNCEGLAIQGYTIIVERFGDDDLMIWCGENPKDEMDGESTRGTLADIVYELETYFRYEIVTKEQKDLLIKTIRGWE